jgi:hypothetical protein
MMKKLLLNIPQLGKGEWWIEVMTTQPLCIYYFGPFSNPQEAKAMQPGYIEDLTQEGVKSIQAVVKQCQPTRLTVFDDQDQPHDADLSPRDWDWEPAHRES